ASIWRLVIHDDSKACKPYSPKVTSFPPLASPRIFPRNSRRCFTRLGTNMLISLLSQHSFFLEEFRRDRSILSRLIFHKLYLLLPKHNRYLREVYEEELFLLNNLHYVQYLHHLNDQIQEF